MLGAAIAIVLLLFNCVLNIDLVVILHWPRLPLIILMNFMLLPVVRWLIRLDDLLRIVGVPMNLGPLMIGVDGLGTALENCDYGIRRGCCLLEW